MGCTDLMIRILEFVATAQFLYHKSLGSEGIHNVDYQNVDYQNADYQNVDYQNADYQNITSKHSVGNKFVIGIIKGSGEIKLPKFEPHNITLIQLTNRD